MSLNIQESVERIRSGKLHPRELTEQCLARIEQWEQRVHAWVLVDAEGARRTADRLGQMAARGEIQGPLHGIPIAIKDIVDVAGWPTRAGSPLREDRPEPQDATLVTRLRAAGAVLLGKTVTTEFACFDPPPTRNPWNVSHTPGGSSSGSAVAVALGMCAAAIGSQTGGSITRPASYCGVAGFKPTHGQVPLDGVVPISSRLDHAGPIARRVADLATMYQVLSGQIAGWSEQELGGDSDTQTPPRFVLLEQFFFETADPAVLETTRAALNGLGEPRSFPALPLPDSFVDVIALHRTIMAVDAARYHRQRFAARPDGFGPQVAALIREGLASESKYQAAVQHQQQFRRDMTSVLEGGVIALTPATCTTAPATLDTTGNPMFNSPWSYCGFPTVTIPCGLASDGMPCGLQMSAAPGEDARLLRAAGWCEQRLQFAAQPPE